MNDNIRGQSYEHWIEKRFSNYGLNAPNEIVVSKSAR